MEIKAYAHAYHSPTWLFFMTEEQYEARVQDITDNKPFHEQSIRLKLFKEIDMSRLPKELVDASLAVVQAEEDYIKATDHLDDVHETTITGSWWARRKANKALLKAKKTSSTIYEKSVNIKRDYEFTLAKYYVQLEILHVELCGCSEWNGERIVFPPCPTAKDLKPF